MSAVSPILIALAVVLPQLAIMISLYLWVHRQRQPDTARIKVLRGLLGFLCLIVLGFLTALIMGPSEIRSTGEILLPLASLFLVAAGIVFQIKLSQRNLRHK